MVVVGEGSCKFNNMDSGEGKKGEGQSTPFWETLPNWLKTLSLALTKYLALNLREGVGGGGRGRGKREEEGGKGGEIREEQTRGKEMRTGMLCNAHNSYTHQLTMPVLFKLYIWLGTTHERVVLVSWRVESEHETMKSSAQYSVAHTRRLEAISYLTSKQGQSLLYY